MAKRVILMGKGALAIQVAGWFLESPQYDLVRLVPVVPEPAWTDSLLAWGARHGVPCVTTGHYKDIPNVRDEDWTIDLAFSVFYDKIIREWFIQRCGRILNLHNSPLPRYRGVSPINWALKNKESRHGVTIHEITPGIDDGPIVAQAQYSIYPEFDEVITVYNRAIEYGWTLFRQTIPILDEIVAAPQDESQATYYDSTKNALLGERRYFTKAESLHAMNETTGEH